MEYHAVLRSLGRVIFLGGAGALSILLSTDAVGAQSDTFDRTELISVNSAAEQGDRDSFTPSISGDGRLVAFASRATDLVPRDRNNSEDVFVHDRTTGQTRLISVNPSGAAGNDDSFRPAISRDGRFVAFQSDANNLVPADSNGVTDVFLFELATGRTTRISVATGGGQADGASLHASISDDGGLIAFHSYAANLDPDDTNRDRDVFVHDRKSGETVRVRAKDRPRDQAAGWDASLSGNGRFVAFTAVALSAVGDAGVADGVFVLDRSSGEILCVSVDSDGRPGERDSYSASISGDGRLVAFASDAANLVPDDTNDATDVFVHDRQTRETVRISIDSDGGQTVDESHSPVISAAGRFVAYWSRARDLVEQDRNERRDVFLYDRETGQTRRMSVNSARRQANGHSEAPALSADGRILAFESSASNLVLCDRNRRDDVFVRGPSTCDGRLAGDSNGDGTVDARDTDAFVMAVTDPCRYQAEFSHCDLLCNNDINGDGDVDFFDIGEFIDLVYER